MFFYGPHNWNTERAQCERFSSAGHLMRGFLHGHHRSSCSAQYQLLSPHHQIPARAWIPASKASFNSEAHLPELNLINKRREINFQKELAKILPQPHTLSGTFSPLNKKDFSQQGKIISTPLRQVRDHWCGRSPKLGLIFMCVLSFCSSLEKKIKTSLAYLRCAINC